MGNREEEWEYEIDLKDLCISILRKWGWLVAGMVIGAAVLGGCRYLLNLRSPDTAETEEVEEETGETVAETAVSEEEIQAEIENLLQKIETLEAQNAIAEDSLARYQESYDLLSDGAEADMDMDTVGMITELVNDIYSMESRILSTNNEILSYEEQIKAYQLQLEEAEEAAEEEAAEEEPVEEEAAAETDPFAQVAKYAILGAFAGLVLVCLYFFLAYILDKRIHLASDLTNFSGLTMLGTVREDAPEGTSARRDPVNRLLDRFQEDEPCVPGPLSEQCGIVAAKIRLLSENRKVMITGTLGAEAIRPVCGEMQTCLDEAGYEVLVVDNPMKNRDALLKLRDYDLVLVEAPRVTKVKEFTELVRFLAVGKMRVLGTVALLPSVPGR